MELAINIAPMANFYDPNDKLLILDGVDDAVISLPDTIALLTGEFFGPRWTGILFERIYPFNDALKIFFGDRVKILNSRAFKENLIFCHRL